MSAEVPTMRADLHSHTWFSPDSLTPPAVLVEWAREAGLDRIAVTDHGEIEGALEARSLDPALVIVGEEIRCRCGTELIGLFLRERIPYGLPPQEVAERIRDQGGIVYAPHPFAYATRAARRAARALAAADLVEVFNSRAFLPAWNRAASREAARRALPAVAGSDAHFPWEIGRAYTEIPEFRDAAGLLAVAAQAVPVGLRTASPLVHVASVTVHALRLPLRGPRSGRRRPPTSPASEARESPA